jgi:type II secretory pathway component PulC
VPSEAPKLATIGRRVEDEAMVLFARSTLPLALLVLVACGESTAPPATAHDVPKAPSAEAATATTAKPISSLKRAQVKETIAQGLGAFLQNVTVDDWPVMHDGKFHGFKIRTINPEWGIDLKPGDVVTRVNGIVPEHPEEADAALRSLEKAPSLKVDFEREGKAKTLELPIVE